MVALALIAACGIAPAPGAITLAILGQRPSYGPVPLGDLPNVAAIDRMIWVPGLDAGWDPQGLAFAAGSLFISAYQSSGMWMARGPCRVFRVDPETGRETGRFDVPPPCGHAGGLAYAGGGKLFVADTHTLFEVDIRQAFGKAGPQFRIFPLGRGLKGAFAASDHNAIWIGDYEERRPAKAFKFAIATIESLADGAALEGSAASLAVTIPTYGQGGAVDASARLWVARSDFGWGYLDRISSATGNLEERYSLPAGIEGIAFDNDGGRLWAVSEAGARHLPWRYPFFPLIFRLDPARLRPAG